MIDCPTKTPAALALTLLLTPCTSTLAEEVFKSVDAEGRVTYSATPPDDGSATVVEELQLKPAPSREDRNAARQRYRDQSAANQQSTQQRTNRREQRDKAVAAAQQQLIKAQANLEQAKIPGNDDYQRLITGARVLNESYRNRVAEAEKQVAEAQAAVDAARQGR